MSGPHSTQDVIGERYQILEYVNEGGMQFVYSATDLILNRKIALKTPKNVSAEKRFHRSAIASARVNHPNVAKTLDYLEEKGRAYLIEEFVEGTDLDKALLRKSKQLDPYLAARIFHYLAKGLAASHHVSVVHRDLKPTNVMVTGDFQIEAIKITDFGIAKMANEEIVEAVEGLDEASITNSQTAVGALPYMAPEAIETPREADKPADVWSIGAMMFHLITGTRPYGTGFMAIHRIIEAKPITFPRFLTQNKQFSPLSEQIIEITKRCLTKEPKERPTADELVEFCGQLFYPVTKREFGTVREIRHGSWGFINGQSGDIFFHLSSVYGDPVRVGDEVMISKFPGGGASRAHPVIKLAKD